MAFIFQLWRDGRYLAFILLLAVYDLCTRVYCFVQRIDDLAKSLLAHVRIDLCGRTARIS